MAKSSAASIPTTEPDELFAADDQPHGPTDDVLDRLDRIESTLAELVSVVTKLSTTARPTAAPAAATGATKTYGRGGGGGGSSAAPVGGKTFDAEVLGVTENTRPSTGGGTWRQANVEFSNGWTRSFGIFPGPTTENFRVLCQAAEAGSMVRVTEAPSKKNPKYHDIVRVEVI